jgi:hypothetical protein
MHRRVVAGLLLLALGGAAAAAPIEAGTIWRNDRGSTLVIRSIDADGRLAGDYVNAAPGFPCQGTPFPVIGWLAGEKIVFSVRWKNASEDCGSLTTWAGFIADGVLVTEWSLVRTDPQSGKGMVLHGASRFTRE